MLSVKKEQTGQEALPVLRRKRGGIMEHLLFYYGSWFMGVICFISTLAVYRSNKRILRDLKNPWETKNKWLINFVQEHQKLLKENAEIHNPSVYVIRRMRGRKIGPWNIRQVKGISWGAFFLSFFFMAVQAALCIRNQVATVRLPVFGEQAAIDSAVITGAGILIVLLGVRMLTGSGYQEEMIETNLLDYVENRCLREPAKILSMENKRTAAAAKEKKAARAKEHAVQTKTRERSKEKEKEQEKEQIARQLEQGVLEAAASDSRYSHLLSKEEKAIVKDVLRDFLP